MREILFRGKRIDNGKWLEGYYGFDDNKPLIAINKANGINGYFVAVETVGQSTGMTDKNGSKKIFEGDIIRANHNGAVGVVRFGEYMSPSDPDLTRHIGYYADWQGKDKDFLRADLGYWASRSDVEIIGNIHDNPELLEEQKREIYYFELNE